jgi:hypothetical protein
MINQLPNILCETDETKRQKREKSVFFSGVRKSATASVSMDKVLMSVIRKLASKLFGINSYYQINPAIQIPK